LFSSYAEECIILDGKDDSGRRLPTGIRKGKPEERIGNGGYGERENIGSDTGRDARATTDLLCDFLTGRHAD
jgi:hypothetical protein